MSTTSVEIPIYKHSTPVRGPLLWAKNLMYKYIMPVSHGGVHYVGQRNPMVKHTTPVRLGCPLLWTKKPLDKQLTPVRMGFPLNPKYKYIVPNKLVQVKNTNTKEDNYNNGAEQSLTIGMRLEQWPEKTWRVKKKSLEPKRKKAGNLGRNQGSCSSDW